VPTRNQQMHLYHALEDRADGRATDRRFFIRAIMRHPDLINKEASLDFMHSQGERLILEALDELELVFSDKKYGRTDCNHVFINAVPTVIMADPAAYAVRLHDLVMRYAPRFARVCDVSLPSFCCCYFYL
jgi:hypothetical protein